MDVEKVDTTTEGYSLMFKNGVRPVHPGELLREDFLKPLGTSANALAKALHVPTLRQRRTATKVQFPLEEITVTWVRHPQRVPYKDAL